jgi:hypothetical protein
MAIGFSCAISRRRQMENGRQLSDRIAGEIAASYPLPALVQDILALFKAGMGWVLPPPIARCPGADDRHRGVVKSLRKIAIVLTGSSPQEWRLCADTVAKVENRTTPKISRKSTFSRLYLCKASERRYEGPWLFLCEAMWVAHVAARETHQRSLKISFVDRKRLFQQYLPEPDLLQMWLLTPERTLVQPDQPNLRCRPPKPALICALRCRGSF